MCVCVCVCVFVTRMAPRFSRSWSVLETPRSTELTPSLRKHHAEWEISQNLIVHKTFESTDRSMTIWCISHNNDKHFLSLACSNLAGWIYTTSRSWGAHISGRFLAKISLRDNKSIKTLTNGELRSRAAQPVSHQVELFDFCQLSAPFFTVHSLF